MCADENKLWFRDLLITVVWSRSGILGHSLKNDLSYGSRIRKSPKYDPQIKPTPRCTSHLCVYLDRSIRRDLSHQLSKSVELLTNKHFDSDRSTTSSHLTALFACLSFHWRIFWLTHRRAWIRLMVSNKIYVESHKSRVFPQISRLAQSLYLLKVVSTDCNLCS